jgi:hypothetical protein
MKPSESPFPCRWESFSLENAGLGSVRPAIGTYGTYDFFALPPLPFEPRGDWSWLQASKPVELNIADEKRRTNLKALHSLKDEAANAGLSLPDCFTRFVSEPGLAERVRSCTCCYLDVSIGLAASPVAGGHLVRFLADSQGCLFWYLYLAANGDHAVVSSGDYYGSPWEEEGFYSEELAEGPLVRNADDISFAEESFEAFMWRFWIENEIWFAGFEHREIPAVGRHYVIAYMKS